MTQFPLCKSLSYNIFTSSSCQDREGKGRKILEAPKRLQNTTQKELVQFSSSSEQNLMLGLYPSTLLTPVYLGNTVCRQILNSFLRLVTLLQSAAFRHDWFQLKLTKSILFAETLGFIFKASEIPLQLVMQQDCF